MARLEEPKVERVEVVGSDIPKGGDSRVTVEILVVRTWGDKGVEVEETLGRLIMGILRWWKRRLTQGFC